MTPQTHRAKVVEMIESNAEMAIDQRYEPTWQNYDHDADYTKPRNSLNACLLGYYENAWDTMHELAHEDGFDTWQALESREELFEIFKRAAIQAAANETRRGRRAGPSLAGTWIMGYGVKKNRPLATRHVPDFRNYIK